MCKGGKKLRFGKVERYEPTLALVRVGSYRSAFPKRSFLPPLHFCFLWQSGTLWADIDKTTISQMCLGRGSRVGGQRSSKHSNSFLSKNCREQKMWRKQLVGWKSPLGEIFGNWHIVQSCWFFTRSFHIFFCISKRPFRSKHSQILKPPGGGFKYFLFSPLLGEMIQFDDHIFRMGWFNTQLDHHNNIWHLGFALLPRALFKEGWRAARPALSTWRFCTTGTDGLDDFSRNHPVHPC